MPDFFLDAPPIENGAKSNASESSSAPSGNSSIASIFKTMEGVLSEEIVKKTDASYQFDLKGKF